MCALFMVLLLLCVPIASTKLRIADMPALRVRSNVDLRSSKTPHYGLAQAACMQCELWTPQLRIVDSTTPHCGHADHACPQYLVVSM
jgi:hypothetical protein